MMKMKYIKPRSLLWKKLKSKTPCKIIFFGDSWTQGYWSTNNATTSFFAQFRDATLAINPNATLINKGISGNTTVDGLARFQTDVINQSPDFCIFNFCINDWGHTNASNKVTLTDYIANLTTIITTLKANGCVPIMWTSGPVCTNLQSYGYGSVVDETTHANVFTDYVAAFKKVASDNKVLLIDVRGRILNEWSNGRTISTIFDDRIHFNQSGHDIIAKVLKGSLLNKR